jgi:hypothetical protein
MQIFGLNRQLCIQLAAWTVNYIKADTVCLEDYASMVISYRGLN